MFNPKQQELYDIISYFTAASFVEYIINEKIDYGDILYLIRKAKLMGLSTPHYLGPIKHEEIPLAQSLKDNFGSKNIDKLSDPEFEYVTLLAFRAHLQYFYD